MIDSKKTLLAYLDILGYKEIINNEPPEKFYKSVNNVFKDLKELFDSLYPEKINSDTDRERRCNAEIINAIKFNILSDVIIIYLHYDDVKRINQHFYEIIDDDYSGIFLFFYIVSTFILHFINNVGFLLRGGICLGEFYSNTFDDCLLNGDLIFSKAFVRSYLLEKVAIYPRILVDESLYALWKTKVESVSKNKSRVKAIVTQDKDGEFYLDFYETLRNYSADIRKDRVGNITKRIGNVLMEKKDPKDKEAWKKWYWFKEYHNHKIATFTWEQEQDLNGLLIK